MNTPATSSPKPKPSALSAVERVLRYLFPVVVTVGLVVWMFGKVDFHKMMHVIRSGCDFWWIAAMMLLTTMSRMIRGIRWGIQLRAAGVPRMSVTAESVSIFGAYALNLLFPWLGEAWRCLYVTKRENVKLSTVIGTDLGDRISDAIVIALLIALAFVVARGPLDSFLSHYAIGKDVVDFTDNPWMWGCLAIAVGLLWAAYLIFRHTRYVEDLDRAVANLWAGFKVLFTMRGRGLYVVLTVAIWVCYFLETYLCFYAFPFTRRLISDPATFYGLLPGLVVFVFGSCSMGVPSNGGLGPWNIAVMFALSLYGIPQTEGAAFSMVVWTCQNLMQIALGIFAAVYVTTQKKKRGRQVQQG